MKHGHLQQMIQAALNEQKLDGEEVVQPATKRKEIQCITMSPVGNCVYWRSSPQGMIKVVWAHENRENLSSEEYKHEC